MTQLSTSCLKGKLQDIDVIWWIQFRIQTSRTVLVNFFLYSYPLETIIWRNEKCKFIIQGSTSYKHTTCFLARAFATYFVFWKDNFLFKQVTEKCKLTYTHIVVVTLFPFCHSLCNILYLSSSIILETFKYERL